MHEDSETPPDESNPTEGKSFWSRPAVRWTITAFLGIVFVLAFLAYLAADLVSHTLLDPQVYSGALDENDIYNRVYTELLADPALENATTQMLAGVNLQELSPGVYSLAISTLQLILPPDTLKTATEAVIVALTSYIKGETERLEPRLDLSSALSDKELMEERITAAIETLLAGLIASPSQNVQLSEPGFDAGALESVAEALRRGEIAAIPEGTLASLSGQVTEDNRGRISEILLGPEGNEVSSATRLQVEAALAANDLPGAVGAAARELMRERVSAAVNQIVTNFFNSESYSAIVGAAIYLEETEERVIGRLNRARDVAAFLDSRIIPLAIILMAVSLGLIAWIHTDSLLTLLRSVGLTLLVAGGLVFVLWFALGLYLGVWLPELSQDSSAEIPQSLKQMVDDVVDTLAAELWVSVSATALVVAVIGIILAALSFIPGIANALRRLMQPVWRYRKAVIVGLVIVVIAIPATVWAVTRFTGDEAMPCNGHVELCDRPLNEVAFAATHNSMSISDYGWLWPSHDGSLTAQLDAGIRAFLIDTHYFDAAASLSSYFDDAPPQVQEVALRAINAVGFESREGTFLCHIMCQLGSTPLPETLAEFRAFLESHPREVVVIVIEDKISVEDTAEAFESSGLTPYLYVHQSSQSWPTLEEMIEQQKRLLVMAEVGKGPPDWYNNVWDYAQETPYSFESPESFNCAPNRGDSGNPFFLLNHWIERVSPSRVDAVRVNEYEFLLNRARQCAEERGHIPNFVAVNFYLAGDVVDVVNELNGVADGG